MEIEVGGSVAVRDVRDGVVYFAWPMRLVGFRSDGVLLAQRPGAVGRVPVGYPRDRQATLDQLNTLTPKLVELAWSRTVALSYCRPGARWYTRLFWDATSGNFLGYYVDFVRPLRFRSDRVDLTDLALDLVLPPSGEWFLKDQGEYDALRRTGTITDDDHEAVRHTQPEVVRAIEERAFPFDGSLTEWTWPAGLPTAVLPPDWQA